MKTILQSAFLLFTVCAFFPSQAQEVASLSSGGYTEAKANETPKAPAANAERTITLKNTSEKAAYIFAGHKEGIRDPKVRPVGGMSKNTLYMYDNDVVCLMTVEMRAIACTVIKETTTTVEINVSANGISSK